MNEPSLADILAFESLPEETQRLAEAFFQTRVDDVSDKMSEMLRESYEWGYNAGYRAGRRKAEANGEDN
jgi:hypothetical protein